MSQQPNEGVPASVAFGTDWFPEGFLQPSDDVKELLDEVQITSYKGPGDGFDVFQGVELGLTIREEQIFELPGFGGAEVVVGGAERMTLTVKVDVDLPTGTYAFKIGGGVSLRLPRKCLRPVERDGSAWVDHPTRTHVEIDIEGGITIDQDRNVSFAGSNEFKIEPAMIANSGFVVEGTVALDLSQNEKTAASQNLKLPGGQSVPKSWQGIVFTETKLHFPDSMGVPIDAIELKNFHIGSGGITGSVELTGNMPAPNTSNAYTLFGMPYQITKLDVQFVQTSLASASIEAKMELPFFKEVVGVELGITMNGGVTATLSSSEGALKTVEKDYFRLELDRFGFELEDEGPAIVVGGTITPKPEGIGVDLTLPGIDVEELRIDADGNVHVEGGWLDLGDQYKGTVAGFGIEITKFGLGKTDDGRKWIGFNGSVKLLEGIPAGASVDGLRIIWDESGPKNSDVSLNGIGVEFTVPETLKFKGEVSFKTDEFRGDIDLELLALDLTIDAEVVFGTETRDETTFDYMGVALDADLPAGIPLWATGLSLYGVGGLFTNKMEPDKEDDQQWFAVSKKPGESWYHKDPTGVTGLKKWRSGPDAMGFGASVALATTPDNGLSVASDLTFVMAFPGPVIMLQGRAELLEKGRTIEGDAPFQALMVLDTRAGSTLLGIDAHYDKSPLIELAASAEAFYSFSDPRAWYLNLGRKDPREDRIRADALWIFTAEAYFMLNNDRLAMGIWTGYDRSWKFGPLKVELASWVSADALLNFQPAHFYGNIQYHGHASLSVFGFGFGATIHAEAEADVFNPLHILGRFSVSVNLPWPLPDPSATITLEWGPEPKMPNIPDPVQEAGIGHTKLASTWDGKLKHPNPPSAGAEEDLGPLAEPPSADSPVVPMDARPEVTFARPVHDRSGVTQKSNNGEAKYEIIGDPAKNEGPVEVQYILHKVDLLAWDSDANTWMDAGDVSGTWAPVPASNGGDTAAGAAESMTQTKLQLFTRTPYHYSRRTGGAWEDAIDRHYPGYPCPAKHVCYDFDDLDDSDFDEDVVVSDHEQYHRHQRTTHAAEPWACFFLRDEGEQTPDVHVGPAGDEQAFIIQERAAGPDEDETEFRHHLQITLPTHLRSVQVRLRSRRGPTEGVMRAYDANDPTPSSDSWSIDTGQEQTLTCTRGEAEYTSLKLDFNGSIAIVEICSANADLSTPALDPETDVDELHAQLARWGDKGEVLEPYTDYRLKLITKSHAKGRDDFLGHDKTTFHATYIDFRTEGPPGLSTPSLPASTTEPPAQGEKALKRTETGLETLARYVHQTMPKTVPEEGEQPPLPRPVYRGDPAAVDFDTDYVDLLYRLANRDLAMYLYDANDEPVRDAHGRLVVSENQWGKTEDLLLDRATWRWFARLDASSCLNLKDVVVERTKRLVTRDDRVLNPDAVHEARLRPLLYRETWDTGLDGWSPVHEGDVDEEVAVGKWSREGHEVVAGNDATWLNGTHRVRFGNGGFITNLDSHRDTITFTWPDRSETFTIVGTTPSNDEITLDSEPGSVIGASYEVPSRYELRQTNVAGSVAGTYGTFFALPSNPDLPASHNDQPEKWTDIRVSAVVGTDSNAPGVVGLVFRRQESTYYRVELDANDTCRLHRIAGNTITKTWTASGGYHPGLDATLTVEAIGDELKVLVDDEPVLRVSDPGGPDAGTVGPYCRGTAGFRCQQIRVDDFRDSAPVAYQFSFTTSKFVDPYHQVHSYDDDVWQGELPVADRPAPTDCADPATPPKPAEHRTYHSVIDGVEGASQLPERFEVSRLVDGAATTGLFVQSPEPIDWTTTSLSVERGPRFDVPPTPPQALKLTGFDFDTSTLSLLVRETRDIDGYSIDYRRSATGGFRPTPTGTVFDGAVSLDEFDIVDPTGAATWVTEGDAAVASSISGWSAAIKRGRTTTDGVLKTTITVTPESQAGIVFRYRSPGQHYRFVVDDHETQLLRVIRGRETALWTGGSGVTPTEPAELCVTITNGTITGSLGGIKVFEVTDPQPAASGRVGILTKGAATFDDFALHAERLESVLLDASFDSPTPNDWTFLKEPPFSSRTSDWRFENGELRQKRNIYGFAGGQYADPGTYGITGERTWTDYRTVVRLQSDDDDAIGVIVRYQDEDNYYRLSMDADREYRRLIRKYNGETRLLWEQDGGFETGREYVLTLECVDEHLVGYLDGKRLFKVTDAAITAGKVGLYCRANTGARFKSLQVVAPADRWLPYHSFEEGVPLSAGTRFEVVDATSITSPDEPRRERRIRNGPPVKLPHESVHFRVRRPEGTPAHARQFRPEKAYTSLTNASVVRSADGTSVFVFGEETLTDGQYRLRFTPTDGGQFVAPVTIDVPWGRS